MSIGESSEMADEFSLVENRGKLSFEKTVEAAVRCKVFLWVLKSAGFVQRLQEQINAKHQQASVNTQYYTTVSYINFDAHLY